jgi:hypothetical protein
VGKSSTNSCHEWRDGTYDNFKEWASRQFGVKDVVSEDEADIPVDLQKAKHIIFKKNKKGYFVLPLRPTSKKPNRGRESFGQYFPVPHRNPC